MTDELKPCPFCGETEALMVSHLDGTTIHPAYCVCCDNCGASTGYSDRGDHIAQWNTRADTALRREREPVKVKPLVWVHGARFGKQEHSYADTELGTWCMTAYSGRGGRWAYTDPCGNDSEDDWLTRDECQTAVEAAREARVFAELETDQAALALVAAAYRNAAERASRRWAIRREHADKLSEMDYPEAKIDAKTVSAKADEAKMLASEIADLTPADAEAHLTALLRAEYERGRVKGWAEAADFADNFKPADFGNGEPVEVEPEVMMKCLVAGIRTLAGKLSALLTQEGR